MPFVPFVQFVIKDLAMEKFKIIYPELSYQIMQAVFEVHNTLGPGFAESIYEEALCYELETLCVPFERQKIITVIYKGRKVGVHRLDLVIDEKIILELKAVSALADGFKKQLRSYLAASQLRLGLVINFGTPKVESVRVVN
jgi:GxxExxY protein